MQLIAMYQHSPDKKKNHYVSKRGNSTARFNTSSNSHSLQNINYTHYEEKGLELLDVYYNSLCSVY